MRCSSTLALLALAAGHAVAQEPSALDARLSPDGRTVAARALDGARVRVLAVVPSDSTGERRWVTPPDVDVETVAWSPDGSRLVYRSAGDGHLYVVSADPDASAPARNLTPGVDGTVRLVAFDGGAAALVELPGEWPGYPDLFRVSLEGGEPVLLRSNDGGVTRWVADGGEPRLAIREGEDGDTEIARLRDGVLVPFYVCGTAEVCEPAGFHPDGRVWVLSSRERAEPALLLVDPVVMRVEVARAELGADPFGIIRADSVYVRDMATLRSLLGEAEIALQESPAAEAGRVLVSARDSAQATLYVFDRWAGTILRVLPLAEPTDLAALRAPLPDASLTFPERLRYRVSGGEPGLPPLDVRRTLRRSTENGREVIVIVDASEVPVFPTFELDTALLADPAFEPDLSFDFGDMEMEEAADTTVLDAATLLPMRRRATGPFSMDVSFGARGVEGSVTIDGFGTGFSLDTDRPVWTDGAGLELLVAALPLAAGYEADLTYFDAGLQAVIAARLVVEDAARVGTDAGDFDAWVVTLAPTVEDAPGHSWWVRRAGPHTLLRAVIESRDYDRTIELIEGVSEP